MNITVMDSATPIARPPAAGPEDGFACTEAYRLWAQYVVASHDPAVKIEDRIAALNAACDLITPPARPANDTGIMRGELALVRGGKRHWFAHKNGRCNPLLWAVYVERAGGFDVADLPHMPMDVAQGKAVIVTQDILNRMAEAAP